MGVYIDNTPPVFIASLLFGDADVDAEVHLCRSSVGGISNLEAAGKRKSPSDVISERHDAFLFRKCEVTRRTKIEA